MSEFARPPRAPSLLGGSSARLTIVGCRVHRYLADAQIRRVMMTAKKFGMLEEALVIVASDNGAMPGGGQGGSNWPLRGQKQTPFEVRLVVFGELKGLVKTTPP